MKHYVTVAVLILGLGTLARVSLSQGQFGGVGGGGPRGRGGQMMFMQQNPTPHRSQDYAVEVTTNRGKSVTGTLALTWVVVNYDLGHYEIEPEKVKEIQFTAANPNQNMIVGPGGALLEGTIITTTGAELAGMVMVDNWKLHTDLGVLTLDAQGLKSLVVKGKAPGPALNGNKPPQGHSETQPAPKEPQSPVEKK